MARRMTRAESNQVRQKALVIKKYLYLLGRTMTDWATIHYLWLPTIKDKLIVIDEFIRHSGLEVFAYDALLQIANGIRNQDKGQGTNELASYIHLNDWLIGVALGEHQRPGEDSENYGGDYRLHFGCVLSKNPRDETGGGRKHKHHQFLTRDFGHPALTEHISNVTFLMSGCSDWKDFKKRLDQAKPKHFNNIREY